MSTSPGWPCLAVLLGLLMISMSAFSVAMALTTKEISAFAAVINGLNLPVCLLAGSPAFSCPSLLGRRGFGC